MNIILFIIAFFVGWAAKVWYCRYKRREAIEAARAYIKDKLSEGSYVEEHFCN